MNANERRDAAAQLLSGVATENTEEQIEQVEPTVEELEEAEEGNEVTDDNEGEQPEVEEGDGEQANDETEGEESEEESDEEHDEESEETEQDEAEPAEIPEDVQQRSAMIEELQEALDHTDYPIDFSQGDGAMTELAARLTDAHILYDIIQGKATMDVLMERALKYQGQEVVNALTRSMVTYLQQKGVVEGGEVDDNSDQKDKRIAELERQLAQRNSPQPRTQEIDERGRQIFASALTELARLAEEAGLSQQTFNKVLVPAMARAVNGNKAIINRVARGVFTDIHRIFDEVKNDMVVTASKRTNAKVAGRKNRDAIFPKRVAGGNRQAAAPAKPDVSTREGRIAAAKAALK